jgi:superfamily I DNA and/or RNA helicase
MEVLKEFQKAIEIEYQKNIQDFNEQENLPIDERVAKGVTMINLKVEFELEGNEIKSANIFCENNISKFKEGNSVILKNGELNFKMDVFEDSTENFILRPNDWDSQFCFLESTNYPKNNWEISAVHTDITTKMLRNTASYLEENSEDLKRAEKFLNGKTKNSLAHFVDKIEILNESQNTAYLNAINTSDFCLIQGPPGTGKTMTIAQIVKQLITDHKKVFVTAPTHTAINNCLSSVAKVFEDNKLHVIKIGEKASNKEIQSNKDIWQLSRVPYSNWVRLLTKNNKSKDCGIAIGATAYSLCFPVTKRLQGWKFDVAIIDEASQLSIPLALAVLSRVKKVIFVGDHKQLDPIIPKESNNEMFTESVFSRLARLYPNEINLLNTSYRLNESLIKIPNTLFYNNLLHSDITTKEDKNNYNCSFYPEILNKDAHTLVLHNVFDSQGRSPFEAKLVADLVVDLLQNGVALKNIGIMSPYRAQVREIKKEISKKIARKISNPFDTLFVDTVDSMQGQERDYIIYSMSNSNPLESMRRLDFFYSPNRLNVAITRAIKKMYCYSQLQNF